MGENVIQGRKFCISGETRNDRALYWALIVECGGTWVKTVSGALDVLVVGDKPGPSKIKKAESLGIDVWSEDDLEAAIRAAMDYPGGSLMAKGWRLPVKREPQGAFAGMRFCITGVTSNSRALLQEAIEARGGKCVAAVSRSLHVLVVGSEPGESKMERAAEYGTEQWTEEQLIARLEQSPL